MSLPGTGWARVEIWPYRPVLPATLALGMRIGSEDVVSHWRLLWQEDCLTFLALLRTIV